MLTSSMSELSIYEERSVRARRADVQSLATVISRLSLWASVSINLSFALLGGATESEDQRVEKFLGQMTLEEKLEYIGGVNAMSIRRIPRLGLPEIRMSD